MSKIKWFLGVLAFPFCSAFAQTQTIPDFVGGINRHTAKICTQEIEKSRCKLKDLFTNYKLCVHEVLVQHPQCKQSLTFFNSTEGGIFKKIRSYKNIDIILADYVYIADQGTGYFLVTHSGQFIALPLPITKKQLKTMSNYEVIAKKYPHVNAWQILDFPQEIKLPRNRYRLVFTQQLKDGCNACALAGTVKVAYDFSDDGKHFDGIKVLKLSPQNTI
ncbi:hypothetical protein [Coxiella burnetii]|uniref:Hypothetical exported protein n=1 Tax=Coxiella burnetii (strain Dugway 5J108-111) TaxID=434922 RepID=A9KB86_COXBN|nr:hypothetical protein [Coxiella burnetii]ABS78048.1 hypothetical exported protein [Coxiella burnetii Dugway 5J108-111]ACJ19485.1 hypothetical exported protein [Coxiella burnetii CbuK_Q154]AIT62510.1 putative exported protein [Coxiella burnetii str. Namibia]ATN85132.1 hypothetical protein AYO29_00705 [Coxiella burnetii str. Schperling]EAX33971.1 hypothetical protein A35_00835 [Coxiella burnetii 'MSU Goat Q177']